MASLMRVISLVNQKGGCGKTTAAINMAAALAGRGLRTLLVDLDPQAHASLGLSTEAIPGATVLELLRGEVALEDAAVHSSSDVWVVPADERLAEFESQSEQMLAAESRLRRSLIAGPDAFDWVVLDCPPRADGVLTANALFASDTAVLVIETGAFALQGARRARTVLEQVSEAQGSRFDMRVLATLFDRRTHFAREVLVALHAHFGPLMFDTAIRSSVRLREAAARGVAVREAFPRSRPTLEFDALCDELLGARAGANAGDRPPLAPSAAGTPRFELLDKPATE